MKAVATAVAQTVEPAVEPSVAPAASRLDTASLDQLFLAARTHKRWLPRPVDEAVLRELHEHLPTLTPHVDARARFAAMPAAQIEHIAAQGSALQGGYVILAARALGLDCGPIGGFDRAKVDAEFFPDGRWKANFLINLGYGDPAGLHPRNPRLAFDDACRIM